MDVPGLLFFTLEAAWRRRYLVIVPLAAMPPVSFLAGSFAPQTFEARTTILVQETAKLNPFLNDLAVGPNLKERMPALNSLAHSSHILEAVLADTGQIGASTPEAEKMRKVSALSAAVSVELMGSDLVAFRIRGAEPKGMAKTLRALSTHFIERLLAPERSSIADSQTFLAQELREREQRLKIAQDALAAFKRANAERLPTLESGLVARLSGLEEKLAENRMALKAAAAELGDIRERLVGTNPVIGQIEDDILKTTRRLVELSSRYTPEHSAVQAEKRNLDRLETERDNTLKAAKTLDESDLDRLWNLAAGAGVAEEGRTPPLLVTQMARLQESNSTHLRLLSETRALEEEIATIHKAIAETGPVLQEQNRLEESIRLAQESFDSVAKRFDNAQITGALGEFEAPERIKVIDQPVDPAAPVTPGRLLFLLAGIAGGMFAGGGLAAAAELLDTRLRSVRQFEQAAGVDVVARFTPA